jgi:hypothetical protein
MSAIGGPNIVEDGLVLALDAANIKGISALGNNSFSGASELVKNLISPNDNIQSVNGVSIGNLDFFTAFGIDYPESSFGGDAASRQGITPGLNVRSGTKTYDASRALHLWVWNPSTKSWLSSNFFNGLRLSGHCYDSYTGYASWQTEVAQFVTDYNNIKVQYPDATYIVMGSHRDDGHTTDKINVLLELGAPSNVSSLLGGSPEWILVGKPGLGAGNAYGWAYENYTTDPTRVAHLNFGLPIYGNIGNYFLFDGVNDYMFMTGFPTSNFMSLSCWFRTNTQQNNKYFVAFGKNLTSNNGFDLTFQDTQIGSYIAVTGNNGGGNLYTVNYYDNVWHHLVTTYDGSVARTYYDGNLVVSRTGMSGNLDIEATKRLNIGSWVNNSSNASCNLSQVSIYNRALSAAEVLQNYNATKGRFGL